MAKGRKRLNQQQEKEQKILQDLKANSGLSKYERKLIARRLEQGR